MREEHGGENLIFLISQPRAGSTLLQRMLGMHPDVHTTSEPWLMLPPLFALRETGHAFRATAQQAAYNPYWAWRGLRDFLEDLPGGESAYYEGIRRMYEPLYARAASEAGKHYFLDKTPRYYFIIPELQRAFPEARFILLFRNPLAVMGSVLRTWVKHRWFWLWEYEHDLLTAPQLLVDGQRVLGASCVTVRYEQLVKEPEAQVQRLCAFLGLAYDAAMIRYGEEGHPDWSLGDPSGVNTWQRPVEESLHRWTEQARDAQVWRLMQEYLDRLGPDLVEAMGYDAGALERALEAQRPRSLRLTFSLDWLTQKPKAERSSRERALLRYVALLRRSGLRGLLHRWKSKLQSTRRYNRANDA
jgi:hypothetical protein